MRKRPSREQLIEQFIEAAPAEQLNRETSKEDIHNYVQPAPWPVIKEKVEPSWAKGDKVLRRSQNLSLKDYEWNSIDRHVKALGVQKVTWIRYAIFKLMQEEQDYFYKRSKPKE